MGVRTIKHPLFHVFLYSCMLSEAVVGHVHMWRVITIPLVLCSGCPWLVFLVRLFDNGHSIFFAHDSFLIQLSSIFPVAISICMHHHLSFVLMATARDHLCVCTFLLFFRPLFSRLCVWRDLAATTRVYHG